MRTSVSRKKDKGYNVAQPSTSIINQVTHDDLEQHNFVFN